MKNKILGFGCLGIGLIALVVIAIAGIMFYVNTNNTLVDMKGQATKQWANVESSYQKSM